MLWGTTQHVQWGSKPKGRSIPSYAPFAPCACAPVGCLSGLWWPNPRWHPWQGWLALARGKKHCVSTGSSHSQGSLPSVPPATASTCLVKTILPSRKGGTRLCTNRCTLAELSSSKSSPTSIRWTTPLVSMRFVSQRSLSCRKQPIRKYIEAPRKAQKMTPGDWAQVWAGHWQQDETEGSSLQ